MALPMKNKKNFKLSCPIPIQDYPKILLAHGGGGKLSHQLIEKMFTPVFNNDLLAQRHDGAVFHVDDPQKQIAFTTDSYVVKPLFFPGGDIGKLAVCGTVNDLAMCGARPLYLSAGFILEEGLEMETLWRIVNSMQEAAETADVRIITGDTKVVDKGKGDQIFINTAGIGVVESRHSISPQSVKPGDVLLINGDIGRHGMAIMAEREGLKFESSIESDCSPLWNCVQQLLASGIKIHCLRDLTRGGLASALNEIARDSHSSIQIEENAIPVREDVHAACEILGLDPLYVACEGRFVMFMDPKDASHALEILKSHPLGEIACAIGSVTDDPSGLVTMKSKIGVKRIVDMMSGEQLPRIC